MVTGFDYKTLPFIILWIMSTSALCYTRHSPSLLVPVLMNDNQLLRYSRHIMLPQFDVAGQEKLLASTALIVGMGGLGSPVGMYLAAAGVGHLILVDFDNVELSNLQRQILHQTADIGRPKVESGSRCIATPEPGMSDHHR